MSILSYFNTYHDYACLSAKSISCQYPPRNGLTANEFYWNFDHGDFFRVYCLGDGVAVEEHLEPGPSATLLTGYWHRDCPAIHL